MDVILLSRTSISVLLIIAVSVWGAFLWLLGIELTWDHAKPYSLTLAALTSAIWIFNSYLWKVWPIRLLCKMPDLNGTWQAALQSSYVSPVSGEIVPPIVGFATVRQSFLKISIRLMTEESESFLVASSFDLQEDGTSYLYGVYQSDPGILFRKSGGFTGKRVSHIHYGSFKYKIVGRPSIELNGHYWTDRGTNGSIRLFDRRLQIFDSYSHANENIGE
jgi:SMODS-associating 2TM, beta-strand rich effector domain